MYLKQIIWMLLFGISIFSLAACAGSPQRPEITPSTITLQEAQLAETPAGNISEELGNACENLGNKFKYDPSLGEIKKEYIGSWHAAPLVGSGYEARFVFFESGNYLYFPSQYTCSANDSACTPPPIEEGTWGIREGLLNLAINGNIDSVVNVPVGEIVKSSADESPYPLKTTIGVVTYWLMSIDTNLWNPVTGELCD